MTATRRPPGAPRSQLAFVAEADVLSPAECRRLITYLEAAQATVPPTPGAAPNGGLARGVREGSIRRADVAWLTDGPETGWITLRLAELVAALNRRYFGFALDGFDEDLQVTRYPAAVAGFYDWHVDRGASGLAARRKLSISIQLDAPTAYQGGALELNGDGHVATAPREQGTAIAFPSFALHRVAPVTAGVRHALVAWVHGPDFV
jgi:PKHD-type hydroxylase